MKKKSILIFIAIISFSLFTSSAYAKPLVLFGTNLKSASRTSLESAIQKAGLIPIRQGFNYWCDSYKVTGQLSGASRLDVCYTKNNRFANAQYIFSAFMNTELVKHVINIVSDKYGNPSSINGNYRLGDVTAFWYFGSNMEIKIFRGWPSSTVYLNLRNKINYQRFLYEYHKQKEARTAKKAKSESSAF
ncbi:MAG: hypothetical protein EVG15_02685 [Candidatus Acididesulfobacter diazotrophicus]|jgi:hypothetical protein|uniref:Uncharacterized protein n=1 Tax=Candidatus Acididesulfobacter diazotrophicus TaxID=2597226 RepID=A0A519BP33_9DELT|nr:MAG: hypothetical protein EVG15_02685 [Candidatus Acididesulfobacter diazotrophicus]